jgi:DNA polymerase I-like protein with 3'-5' exonuclease and polymerase domains
MVTISPPSVDAPLPELLRFANLEGVRFRLAGHQVEVTAPRAPSPTLAPVLAALKAHKEEVWATLLGGDERDKASLALLTRLGVAVAVPNTVTEAEALFAEMEADADTHTPADIRRVRGGLLGLDIETAANPGEGARPPVKLRLRDGKKAKNQPAFKSDAALNPHRATVRLVQLYGGGRRCLVLDTTKVPITALASLLSRRVMVVHNASFELRFLTETGLGIPRFEDTMQATGLLLGAHRRSLEEAASAYLGVDLPKELQKSDWSAPVLSPGQLAYAALDSIVVWKLWPRLRIELQQKQRGRAYVLQRDVTPASVRMTRRGILLDPVAHRQQIHDWQAELATAQTAFTEATRKPPPTKPDEVRAVLPELLPEDVIAAWPRTGKKQLLSTKVGDLKHHVGMPAIRELLAISAKTKLLSSFGEELLKKISLVTGRLHPNFNVASTKAGRFSSSAPNAQQMPKHKAKGLRRSFRAARGMTFIIGDFNMMEVRGIGAIANDSALNTDLANGVDIHRRQAAETAGISEVEVSDEQRTGAKPTVFGTIYGAGGRGLAASAWINYGIVKSPAQAETERHAFLARYPDVDRWMDQNWIQSNRQGFIATGRLGRVIEASWEHNQLISGRYNYRPGDEDEEDAELDEEMELRYAPVTWRAVLKRTLCCNAPVQGACADASMLTLLWVDDALVAAGIEGGVVLFVHDEFVLEVRKEDAERAAAILENCMRRAFAATFPNAPINNLVELKVQDVWGAGEPGAGVSTASEYPNGRMPSGAERDAEAVADQERRTGRGPDRTGADVPVACRENGTDRLSASKNSVYRRPPGSEIWLERFANYERVRGRPCYLTLHPDGWVTGGWSLGGNYKRHADYHGAYPITLLRNIDALFPDRGRVLHVFSGAIVAGEGIIPGDTIDINPALNPTYCVDAETCDSVTLAQYDFALVDPPYTPKDAAFYGTRPINRGRVLGTLAKGLPAGALIVWLDETTPPYRQDWPIKWQAMISVSTSGGHRTRTLFVYRVIGG